MAVNLKEGEVFEIILASLQADVVDCCEGLEKWRDV